MAILGYNDYFPYSAYRPSQEKVIQEISEAVALGKNSILIATNGTGKTVMALSAALPIVMHNPKRKILFCSRTFTQNARVIEESKEIIKILSKKDKVQTFGALSLRGRNEMCIHKTITRLKLPPRESMTVCASLRKNKRCKFFTNLFKKRKNKDFEDYLDILAESPLDSQELMELAEKDDLCPYFLTKILLAHEKIVVCNYQWIFEPNIRKNFLEALGITLSDCVVIMDECHNLPEIATGINSFRLTPFTLSQALKDLEIFRATHNLIRFLENLADILKNIKKNQNFNEVKLKKHRFLQEILDKNKFNSLNDLKQLLSDLNEYGEAIQSEKIERNMLLRDHIFPIVDFFNQYIDHIDDEAYFPCLTMKESSKGKSIALEVKCFAPRLITDHIFKESLATLSLSGTLHPFTYTQLLGLNETGKKLKIIKMKPPFPKKNAKVLLTRELNTRGNNRTAEMYRAILIALKPILMNTPKNIGVFCASYEVLNGLLENDFERLAKMCDKKVYHEEMGLSAKDNDVIIENFKFQSTLESGNGAVLLGVCGGRNSEGEDFPGDNMNAVVVVGIPFQRPTPSGNAKNDYYEKLFPGKGRLFGYTIPALQRANQACGRPIRKMDDKGLIVLMDNRFGQHRIYLSDWIQQSIKKIPNSTAIMKREVQSFFNTD
ncbi:MAG: helicase C-terminal domain-containing protein [Promethearchaeota archaeon]